MERDKVISKIKKLLRLAKSDNVGEASNALRAAQNLMIEYNIQVDDEHDKISVKNIDIYFTSKGVSVEKRLLLKAIASHFRCKWFYCGNRITLIGYEADAEALKEVYEWIILVYDKLAHMYLQKQRQGMSVYNRQIANKLKHNYLCGFCKGLRDSLEANVKEKGLMLVIPNAVMKEFESFELRTVELKSTISLDDLNSINEGYRDGKEAMSMKNRIL